MILDTLILVFGFIALLGFFAALTTYFRGKAAQPWLFHCPRAEVKYAGLIALVSLIITVVLINFQLPTWTCDDPKILVNREHRCNVKYPHDLSAASGAPSVLLD